MKLGMPTLVQYTSMTENVQLCNMLGLEFIELSILQLSEPLNHKDF